MKRHSFTWKLLVFIAAAISGLPAQNPSPKPLTLDEAIQQAITHYPSIRAALEREQVAHAGVRLAETAYLPTANALWQGNRATRNNIFGQLLPQAVIPSISGPVLPTTSNEGATGSAAGLLVSWEPFDFGYRSATVNAARANQAVSGAEASVTRLELVLSVTNAFTSLASAQQVTRAAQANVDRREVFARSVHTLVDNQLRPGADASRADAELASARISLIQAQTSERVSLVNLARLLNLPPATLAIDAGHLLDSAPQAQPDTGNVQSNPVAVAQNARVNLAASQVSILERAYFPHFNLQGALSGRGTSANNDGTFGDFSEGLGIQRRNWAVGLTATFGLGDFFSIRARKQGAEAAHRVEEARYAQTMDDLNGQLAAAQATFEGARQIAENTPVELRAARDGENQARARYQAGLATAVEVSDAQALLVRAEIDDAVSKLNTWRTLAGIFAARGDVGPFIDLVRATQTGGH